MATTSKHVYHVKRLVSGATGTNTINVYHLPALEGECELDEPPGLTGDIGIEIHEYLVEGHADVEEELYDVAGHADVPPPVEPIVRGTFAAAAEPAVQGHADLDVVEDEPEKVVAPLLEDLDAKAIADAMKEAARLGVPFCEECTRARLRIARTAQPKPDEDVDAKAMADAMKEAARMGVPFCEQCTRARLKQQRAKARA